MAKIPKINPFFLAFLAFLIFSFQVRAIPMFGSEEKEPATSSGKSPAETLEEQGRRETDAASLNAPVNEAARAEACGAVDPSLQNDSLNTAIDEAVAEENRQQEEQVVSALENFRTAAADPALTRAERLIIDPESGLIRPRSEADRKIKGKNETIIAALKGALQLEFTMFQPALIDKIVEEELPHSSTWSMFETLQGKPALSTETLQRILEKADNAMAERTFVEGNFFTLQHFRNALAQPENKGEQRLIIRGQGASALIVAQVGSNHVEDAIIRKTFKRALEREGHRRDFVHELTSEALPYLSMFAKARKIRTPLSFEKLNTILQQADDAMAEIKLLQATRSVVPLSATAENRAAARTLLRSSIENFFSRLGIQGEALAVGISAAVIPKSAEELAAEHAAATQQATREKNETEKVLRSLICRGRNADAFKEHYREAEAAAIASEAYQNQAMEARWNAEGKAQYLTQARAFFQEVKALLDEKRELSEFNESTLSKISQGAELTSVVLGMVNVPFVSLKGIADAVSTFATFADQRLTIAEAQRAYKRLQVAIQEAETATQGNEQVEETANAMHVHAEKIEALKKQEDQDETIRFSNLVKLPSDANDVVLRQWATELACEADAGDVNQATTTAHLLYKQAKKNRATIHELVSKLWGERVALLQQEAERLTKETPLDAEYQSAQKKEVEAQSTASAVRARLEEAAQAKHEWLSKRDQLRQEKKNLEDQLRTDAEHREERQGELEAKRRELSAHQTKKETIDSTYQTAAAEAKSLTSIAAIAHADAFEKFKIITSAKQLHARNTARFQAAAEVDQKVFDAILVAEAKRNTASLQAAAEVEQKVFDEILIAEDHRRAAQIREAIKAACDQLKAASARGDTEAVELQKEIVTFLRDGIHGTPMSGGGLNAYRMAAKKQAQGNREAAEVYRKVAQTYEALVAHLIQERAASACGDKKAKRIQWEIGFTLGYDLLGHGALFSYFQVVECLEYGNKDKEAIDAYLRSAQAYEAEAAALARGDRIAAELHGRIASALGGNPLVKNLGAGPSYRHAAWEQARGNMEAAEAHRKNAQACEARAAALTQQLEAVAQKSAGAASAGATSASSADEDKSKSTTSSSQQQQQFSQPKLSPEQQSPSLQEKPPASIPRKKGNGNCTVS